MAVNAEYHGDGAWADCRDRKCPTCGELQPIRWRTYRPVPRVAHVAGVVVNSVEWRGGHPRIVDRRQCCELCGLELVRGRWAIYFDEAAVVIASGSRAPILTRARAGDDTALCNEATEHREAG